MKRLWFKAKTYGYGWYPATWEAWVTMAVFIAAVALTAVLWFRAGAGPLVVVGYLASVGVLTGGVIALCVVKGEKARWR
jgi:hypothetical protein